MEENEEKVIEIQERDKKILKLCYEQNFLLSEHISDHFFQSDSKLAARRIKKLQESGYIRYGAHPFDRKRNLIRISRLGKMIASSMSPIEFPYCNAISKYTLAHAALVTSVRLRLEKIWDGVWIPEMALKQLDTVEVPDGVFLFKSGTRVAIEVENSIKGKSRFLKRLAAWREEDEEIVLYVATSEEIYRYLKDYLQHAPVKPLFALVLWDELKTGQPVAWSAQGELGIFLRREL